MSPVPKPWVINKPKDLEKVGFSKSEIESIILNKREWDSDNRHKNQILTLFQFMYFICTQIETFSICYSYIFSPVLNPYLLWPMLVSHIRFKNSSHYYQHFLIFTLNLTFHRFYMNKMINNSPFILKILFIILN